MERVRELIISDVHLGAEGCKRKQLVATLEAYNYDKLIIVGDLRHKGAKLSDEEFKIISFFRNIREKVIYIDGNHDPKGESFFDEMIGIEAMTEYRWEGKEKNFCVLHGHRFDHLQFVFNESLQDVLWLTYIRLLQILRFQWDTPNRIDYLRQRYARFIAREALFYAYQNNIDVIICGHTHVAAQCHYIKKKKTVNYFNAGSWVGDKWSYITVDDNDKIKLHICT